MCIWKAPIEKPNDEFNYYWNEELNSWTKIIEQ
jgi:hypothetical protein